MRQWLTDLDRVLRGETTQLSALRGEKLDVPACRLSGVVLVLAVLYGVCMGSFAVFRPGGPVFIQLAATALKVPALFFLTLLVTFPSLYVSNALVGSRLSFSALFRLLIASLAVNVAVLASLGPIVAFFSLTTTSYSFVVLLNVLVFAVSGSLGVAFLLQTLHRLTLVLHAPPAVSDDAPVEAEIVGQPGVLERPDGRAVSQQVKTVVRCWVVVFALVGAQMGWVLRPFVGDPNVSFQWFRARESNFFQAVLNTLASLFS